MSIQEREILSKDRTCKVVVIGAGMTGILTAYKLQEMGLETIVLEAGRIGSGETQNTTAKITSQHGLIYQRLLKYFPKEFVRQYGEANQKAIEDYQRLVQKLNIACDFQRRNAYLYTFIDRKILEKESKAALFAGIISELTNDVTLPFAIKGALKFENQASFHPLLFLQQLANQVEIYENTKVTGVEENKVFTETATIKADYVVFATQYPFLKKPGYYHLRMHQEINCVVAIKYAMKLNGMYYGVDSVGDWSFRNAKDLLLFEGSNQEMLRQKAREFWPESVEVSHWCSEECVTLDGVPYIGQYSSTTPNWYVATGFGKWGMSLSMVAAHLISQMIHKQETGESGKIQNAEIFSAQRFNLSASLKSIYEEGIQAVKDGHFVNNHKNL